MVILFLVHMKVNFAAILDFYIRKETRTHRRTARHGDNSTPRPYFVGGWPGDKHLAVIINYCAFLCEKYI